MRAARMGVGEIGIGAFDPPGEVGFHEQVENPVDRVGSHSLAARFRDRFRNVIGRGGPILRGGSLAGVAGLLLYLFGFSAAYGRLDAGTGALLLFGTVQVVMFAGALAGGEGLPPRRIAGAMLALAGLMAVAGLDVEPTRDFERVAVLSEKLVLQHPEATGRSIGMSGDYLEALSFGATHLRIGTAITGNRTY